MVGCTYLAAVVNSHRPHCISFYGSSFMFILRLLILIRILFYVDSKAHEKMLLKKKNCIGESNSHIDEGNIRCCL